MGEHLQDHASTLETLPAVRYKKNRKANEPKFAVREALFRVLGVDLSRIHGFGAYTVLRLVGEWGMDMSQWPTVKHFTSWLTWPKR